MSSPTSEKSPDKKQSSPSKLDQLSLGEHTKRTQGHHPPKLSKKLYVNSWVASQSEGEEGGETDSSPAQSQQPVVPVIILTDADDDQGEPESTETVPGASQQSLSKHSVQKRRRGSLDSYQRTSPGSRRKTMTIIDQPIIEEPEDGGTLDEDEEHKQLQLMRSEAVKLTIPTTTTTSGIKHESRQRAKSYPAYSQDAAQPMLELPHRINSNSKQDVQQQADTAAEKTDKLRKFTHMAIMAKKWKKRSDSTGDTDSVQDCEESVAIRQKKRPYIELPRALKLDMLADAYPIIQKTYQMYKSYLGPKHQLTILAEQHLERLNIQLGRTNS